MKNKCMFSEFTNEDPKIVWILIEGYFCEKLVKSDNIIRTKFTNKPVGTGEYIILLDGININYTFLFSCSDHFSCCYNSIGQT